MSLLNQIYVRCEDPASFLKILDRYMEQQKQKQHDLYLSEMQENLASDVAKIRHQVDAIHKFKNEINSLKEHAALIEFSHRINPDGLDPSDSQLGSQGQNEPSPQGYPFKNLTTSYLT